MVGSTVFEEASHRKGARGGKTSFYELKCCTGQPKEAHGESGTTGNIIWVLWCPIPVRSSGAKLAGNYVGTLWPEVEF